MGYQRYVIWDKTSNLVYPNGREATPEEVFQEFPATRFDDVVLEHVAKGVVGGIETIGTFCALFGVEEAETKEESLALCIEAKAAMAQAITAGITPDEIDQAIQEGVASI